MEDNFLEIAKYTLPALVVLGATYLTTKTLLDAQATKLRLENGTNFAAIAFGTYQRPEING